MRKIKVVVLLVRQLQHGFTKNAKVSPNLTVTHISKVTDICTLNEIKLYYKLINKQLPQYFNSFICGANSDIHGYNTRTRNKLHTLKTNHDCAQKSLRYRIIQTINKLPDNVIRKMHTHSIYGLTNYAKKYLISNYKTECNIDNCYTVMSMLNAVIISGMSIVSFIIKHTHFSGRNVMLRSVSDRIDGGSPGVCVWEIGQVLPGLCFFSSKTLLVHV